MAATTPFPPTHWDISAPELESWFLSAEKLQLEEEAGDFIARVVLDRDADLFEG